MGVEPKISETHPKSSILIGFSIINHPFWGTPIFGNTMKHHINKCHPFRFVARSAEAVFVFISVV